MGGRNKHRNTNRRANNQNRDNKHENNNYPKASEQDLQMECLQLYELLTNKTKILKEQKLDYCYLISTKWLEDWKQYVGYYNLSENDQRKHKKIGKKHPGKINFDLVADSKPFYQVPLDDYDYLNTVVNEKKQQDDDFIGIAQQIWLIFASKYDHVEIKRPKRVTKKGSVLYDGVMLQLQVIIANYTDDELVQSIQSAKFMPKKDLDDEFPCSKMQLSTLWTLADLQKFIQKYCQAVYEQKQFKLWKIEGYATVGQIQRGLWEGINKKQSKISLPCRQLTVEKYQQLDLDEFLKDYYSLVLEVGKSRIQKAQVPEQLEGYCEQCIKKKPLHVKCVCEEMFYCSEQCRVVDQVWHEKVCKQAFDSEDDQTYKKKSIDFTKQNLPVSGLGNLGNTCYMNSVLQSMVGIKDFSNYFSTHKFQKQIDQKEFQENKGRLLYKYSKFLKALTQTKQSLSPWSLKGQVNYFLPPFKGFKQHDANDFLINFVNSLNQQLCKSQGKAFHPILQENFLGEFNSQIRCPDCSIQISNDQIFTQLTLPIKQKAKVLTTNYVIYQNPKKIIHGKCYVQGTWQKMRKNLQLNSSCLLMAARQGEQAIDVDEDETVQKTIKKIKRELVFYPNCNYDLADQLFSIIPITEKTMFGNRMKSPYGYPAIININPQLHTLGTFWVEILKLFCPQQIYQEAIKIKQNYFNQIQSAVVLSNQKDSASQTEASQKDRDELQQNLTKEIDQKFNKQLKQLLTKNKINVFVNDIKKQRNVCAFCKKKCTGCQLPVNFKQELKQFLQGKIKQVNFEILLGEKIETEKIQKDTAKSGEATLHDCMELLTEPEQLDEQNAWWCETCQNLRLAYKQLTIKKLPKVLIIHLNRFKADGDKKVKNSQPIEYEEYQVFYGKKYRLLSVIVHEGSTQGGHYWAICRRNEKYYIFNDSKVSQTEKICNKNAYILIYEAV